MVEENKTDSEWNTRLSELAKELWIFFRFAISATLDAIFVVWWYRIQVWYGNRINPGTLEGWDAVTLSIFTIVFGVTTLVPVLGFMVVDTLAVLTEILDKIQEFREKNQKRKTKNARTKFKSRRRKRK